MNVYYNSSFGCLVCPKTHMGNTPMRVVIDPVTALDKGFTATMLGEANLFDEKAKRLFPQSTQIAVIAAVLRHNCDLTITFSNGLILESFVNASFQQECWRLFRPKVLDGDLIVTGTGAKY